MQQHSGLWPPPPVCGTTLHQARDPSNAQGRRLPLGNMVHSWTAPIWNRLWRSQEKEWDKALRISRKGELASAWGGSEKAGWKRRHLSWPWRDRICTQENSSAWAGRVGQGHESQSISSKWFSKYFLKVVPYSMNTIFGKLQTEHKCTGFPPAGKRFNL